MTAEELISKLSALSPEDRQAPVYTEGCDCTGPARDIEVEPFFSDPERSAAVIILRDHTA